MMELLHSDFRQELREAWAGAWAEGYTQGQLMEARRIVLVCGRKKLGPPDATALAIIDKILHVEIFEHLAVKLLDVASWEELLASLPAPRNRNGKNGDWK